MATAKKCRKERSMYGNIPLYVAAFSQDDCMMTVTTAAATAMTDTTTTI